MSLFTNYFLLHKNNLAYFFNAVSVLPADVRSITWNEYYLYKPKEKQRNPNLFRVLWRYPAFRWALITGLGSLLLYILLGMRRKQRSIPVTPRLKNESLDFVKTMGRLYYDRKDHHDMASKMAIHFQEHLRVRYKWLDSSAA